LVATLYQIPSCLSSKIASSYLEQISTERVDHPAEAPDLERKKVILNHSRGVLET
jgi:arsenate reductase-like glutaredoxin family protein